MVGIKIDQPVTVAAVFDHQKHRVWPVKIWWKGREYKLEKLGLCHSFWEGKVKIHIFSLTAGGVFLRLRFDSDNLGWQLEEIAENGNN